MADAALLQKIDEALRATSNKSLHTLFIDVLHWGKPNQPHPIVLPVPSPVGQELSFEPLAEMGGVPVFRVPWGSQLPTLTQRRAVHRALSSRHVEHLLCYVTEDQKQIAFVWARRRGKEGRKAELRTLSFHATLPARTTVERIAELYFDVASLGLFGEPAVTEVTDRLNRAFDVQAVTEQFFEGYRTIFAGLRNLLEQQHNDAQWAHDYALQLLNRLMFLYFIQRKGWLGNRPDFVSHFWESYKRQAGEPDRFYDDWLSVLFFEAFNRRFQAGASYRSYLPEDIRNALAQAPYLNGGLFTRNSTDTKFDVKIPDKLFVLLFDKYVDNSTPGFLERYNFTISESTPFDVEVAVDPEMIGKVYESLVNASSFDEDKRGEAGIFYTPRVEIDLMCRLSLVDYLTNHLGAQHKELLYQAVFAYEQEEKEEADELLARHNLWHSLHNLLRSVTVCDPACGSGSFLVGMLLALDDLIERANRQLGIEETAYERRRRIIGESLYGVDVMDWAVHVAELRLWLQLVVETDLQPGELWVRPLLPNLTFKVRPGDSLLQEVGGVNFNLHRQHVNLPPVLKGKITQLKGKKLRFYQSEQGLNENLLKQEELQLFREIMLHRKHILTEQMEHLKRQIESPSQQLALDGSSARLSAQQQQQRQAWIEELRQKQAEQAQVDSALKALTSPQSVPFVWDIAFVEIFESDKGGFDIVIGNPPYVRQESINDPLGRYGKEEYKDRLIRSLWATYPRFFGYNPARAEDKGNPARKWNKRNDLYVYFYLHGLSLLNPEGSFCFITSNSWLDVGFGKDLQEFLLKHSHVKMILDNSARRSFAQADVNTVIVLLAPPQDKEVDPSRVARFVMFRVPFEEVLSPVVFTEIDETTDRLLRPEFRVIARTHDDLYAEGIATIEEEQNGLLQHAQYEGNKWGGKYLRAPDIYFTILEKGEGKLVRLGDIAEVRRGFTTGANEFFYLEPVECTVADVATGKAGDVVKVKNGAGWIGEIETAWLRPVIKSPRELKTLRVRLEDLHYLVFTPPDEVRSRLDEEDSYDISEHYPKAWAYIQWGESKEYHKQSTCAGRPRWWDLGEKRTPHALFNKGVNNRHFITMNVSSAFADQQIYEICVPDAPTDLVLACANSSLLALFTETGGRGNFGEGVLWIALYEATGVYIPNPIRLTPSQCQHLLNAFEQMASREVKSIFEELGLPRPNRDFSNINPDDVSLDKVLPDRRELDKVVFEALGLTEDEQLEVYRAVVALVKNRLVKARSV